MSKKCIIDKLCALPHTTQNVVEWAVVSVVAVLLVFVVTRFLIRIEYCVNATSSGRLELVNIAKSKGRMRVGSSVVVKLADADYCRHIRIAGVPGDTVSLVDGCAIVNGAFIDEASSIKSTFRISQGLSFKFRHRMSRDAGYTLDDTAQTVVLPVELRIKNWLLYTYAQTPPNMPSRTIYPYDLTAHNNAYNMHRFRLPRAGDEVTIDARNLLYYAPLIRKYEQKTLPEIGDTFRFEHSYFWFLNDVRDIFSDSRTFGPLPEYLILGTIL
ncbi:MAG: hypothetical protein IKR17_00470 [Bacteroidales bacterium]|nr:hypothetical protein [Bacteroidales bacterium]